MLGRFIFVIFAATSMEPQDFGRFGLLVSLATVIPGVAGLEAYQILLRRILHGSVDEARKARFDYFVLGAFGAGISALAGAAVLAAFGWPISTVVIGSLVIGFEHIGLEVYRNLINERRPILGVLNVAFRSGIWAIALPLLSVLLIMPEPWSLNLVLGLWLSAVVVGIAMGAPLWTTFAPPLRDLRIRHFTALSRQTLSHSWRWVVSLVSWRIVEQGGRFWCALLISEAVSGRFSLLSIIASVSFVAQKGVIEPMYQPKLLAKNVTRSVDKEFTVLNLITIIGGIIASSLAIVVFDLSGNHELTSNEITAFIILCSSFAVFGLSQGAHFQLYRNYSDATIMNISFVAATISTIMFAPLTWFFGITGAAIGTFLGAIIIWALKALAAHRIKNSSEFRPVKG